MRRISKKGFTLVEVLGVLVIIGVLALIVVPKITEYMQNGKTRYNEKLGGQLLLSGKSYFSDNKQDLPTTANDKKYSYITWDELDSEKYTTNKLTDSEGRDCSKSYVYVKASIKNPGKYEYTPCLICEDTAGNVTNHNKTNPYCNISNWTDEEPPTCDNPEKEYSDAPDTDNSLLIENPNDLLSKNGAAGKIIGIKIETTTDTILPSLDLRPGQEVDVATDIITKVAGEVQKERKNIKVGIVDDSTVYIDVSDKSVDDIAKIDMQPIIKYLFNPTSRGDDRPNGSIYSVVLIDHAGNESEACLDFKVGDTTTTEQATSGDTCNISIEENTVTIRELVVDRPIADIFYYDGNGNRISILRPTSLLPAGTIKVSTGAAEQITGEDADEDDYVEYGYDAGYGFVIPGTTFVITEQQAEYIKDLQVLKEAETGAEEGAPNPPIACSTKKEGALSVPTCTGKQTDRRILLNITAASGINDVHYRNINNIKQSLITESDKEKTELVINQTLDPTAPEEVIPIVEDKDGQTKVCDMEYIHNPEPGAPECKIEDTTTSTTVISNLEQKDHKTYRITCEEKEGSTLTVASNWRDKITTQNSKGTITKPATTPENGKKVIFNLTYTGKVGVAGIDYIIANAGLVTANSKPNTLARSPKINVDRANPNITMTLGSKLKGTLSGETGVYFTPFILEIGCKDSTYNGVAPKLYIDVKTASNAGTAAVFPSKASANPKTYTVKSFANETPYKKGDPTTTSVYQRVYKTKCVDAAGNSISRNGEYKVGQAPKSNCKFTTTPTSWLKKGDVKTFKIECSVPAGNATLKVTDTKNDNGRYSKIKTDASLGVIKSCTSTGNNSKKVTITCKYHVYNNKTGTEKINIKTGLVTTSDGTSNTPTSSSKFKVDSVLPTITYNRDSNTRTTAHHSGWTFKIKCSDTGSSPKNIKVRIDRCKRNSNCDGTSPTCTKTDWLTYSSNPKEIEMNVTAVPYKYEAYCTDKAGNRSTTVKRNYYVRINGAHSCCGVKQYKSCRASSCSCALRKRCNKCSCYSWAYKTVNTYKWQCVDYVGDRATHWMESCSNPGATKMISFDREKCTCKKYGTTTERDYCSTFNRCSACACEKHNKCEAKACGVKSYKTCWHY